GVSGGAADGFAFQRSGPGAVAGKRGQGWDVAPGGAGTGAVSGIRRLHTRARRAGGDVGGSLRGRHSDQSIGVGDASEATFSGVGAGEVLRRRLAQRGASVRIGGTAG